MTDTPDRADALRLIGQCWAGGKLTGKALALFHAGDYAAAKDVALAQQQLQEVDPEPADARRELLLGVIDRVSERVGTEYLDRLVVAAPLADAAAVTAALGEMPCIVVLVPEEVDATLVEIAERNDLPVEEVRKVYREVVGEEPRKCEGCSGPCNTCI